MKTLLRVCACALTLTGCVSVDGTRAQLASKNEIEIRKGEIIMAANTIKVPEKHNTKFVAHRGCSGLETENTAAAFLAESAIFISLFTRWLSP